MATDFFQRQSEARTSTTWLISMFCLAVIGICITVFAVSALVAAKGNPDPLVLFRERPNLLLAPVLATVTTLILIVGGTLYKVLELRHGGGTMVAERMGGRRLYPNTTEAVERKLLNVVEEMALASGTPVPPVFLLDESGINAFAAGYSASDAVLGVTRGCATQLTRDELQGVIAHEFSHILNGDMRMSIRLIGVLHGILLLGLAGQAIFRLLYFSGHGNSRDREKGGGQILIAIFLLGIALMILGFMGTFLGNLIKAAVSRQREFLADASAVQFTRNPEGLSGALKKIGSNARGSKLKSASAAEASHMLFAKGVFEGFSGLWATHPSLEKRILAIEPNWDGTYPKLAPQRYNTNSNAAAAGRGAHAFAGSEVPVAVLDHAVEQVGEPTQAHQDYAVDLLKTIPSPVLNAAREPYGARAVIFSLLLDRQIQDVRQAQIESLNRFAKQDVIALTNQLSLEIDKLDVRARLPIVDIALPALRAMSQNQYREFALAFEELVRADKRIELFEWMLSQVLMRHLRPQFEPVRSPRISYYGLQKLGGPCSALLSAISYAGNTDRGAELAFNQSASQLPEVTLTQATRHESGLAQLLAALKDLSQVSAKHRGRLVDACARAICADNQVQWQEAELLRGISDLLDCPMPPLLVAKA